jgi:uncharacterized protein
MNLLLCKEFITGILFVFALSLVPLASLAASFDCSKELSRVEKTICQDKELSNLDDQLTVAYREALLNSTNQEIIKREQRRWIKVKRNRCHDTNCLRDAYTNRLKQLMNPNKGGGEITAINVGTTLRKTNLTSQDRQKWHEQLKWPTDCEEAFQSMANYAPDTGLKFYKLSDMSYLVQIQCYLGAYQPGYVFMLYHEDGSSSNSKLLHLKRYERDTSGKLSMYEETEVAGFPDFDFKRKTLKILSKSRGSGDCGSLVTYRFDSGEMAVVDARAQACYDDPKKKIIEPGRWERVAEP